MESGQKELIIRMALRAGILAACGLALWLLRNIVVSLLVPFVLAFLMAVLLNPIVRRLARLGGTRKTWAYGCVALVMAAAVALLTLAVLFVVRELRLLAENWQSICDGLIASVQTLQERAEALIGRDLPVDTVLLRAMNWLSGLVEGHELSLADRAGSWAGSAVDVLFSVLVFIVSCFFITAGYTRIRSELKTGLPQPVVCVLRKINRAAKTAFGGYFRAQLILSGIVFLIALAGLLAARQPFAALLALLAAIFDFIPIFGSGVCLIPMAVICLVTGHLQRALWALVLSFLCFMFRRLTEPHFVGSQTGLPPLVSLGCIYVGMCYGGIAGMILTPVLCLMARELFREGLFDGLLRDIRLSLQGIRRELRQAQGDPDREKDSGQV